MLTVIAMGVAGAPLAFGAAGSMAQTAAAGAPTGALSVDIPAPSHGPPLQITGDSLPSGRVQAISVDRERALASSSLTDRHLKTDLSCTVLGSGPTCPPI